MTPLSKFLAHAGAGSRRGVIELIHTGLVKINGVVVKNPAHRVVDTDVVTVKGKRVTMVSIHRYIMLYKPLTYITTLSDECNRPTVLDFIPNAVRERMYPVGRLDNDTSGLLLMTNDGELAHRLAHPRYQVKKVHQVLLDKPLSPEDFNTIGRGGVRLTDGSVKVDHIEVAKRSPRIVHITLHSGRNRIVRRLFGALGYGVHKLCRTEYGSLSLRGLSEGKSRVLTNAEVKRLKESVNL